MKDWHFPRLCLLVAGMAAFAAGCSKSVPPASDSGEGTQASVPLASLHWLGKQRLATEGNATNFISIWNKPESARLEAQTLEKLSTAPWRLLRAATPLAQAPTHLMRPLLDDLVQAESYLEVQGGTNQPAAMVFAIRLDSTRATLWRTNLAAILESLAGSAVVSSTEGQSPGFAVHYSKFEIELNRSGDWTLLGLTSVTGPQTSAAAAPQNQTKSGASKLLSDVRARVAHGGAPFPAAATNNWIEAEMDAAALSQAMDFGWKLPTGFPRVSLTLTGDGQNVRTRGELNFERPIAAPIEPWNVPLNLTAEPLIGLTVARSLTPLLEQLGILSPEVASQFPSQFLVWLRSGPPLQIYYAYPAKDATNEFRKLAIPITQWVNSHADPSRFGSINLDTNANELKWTGLSFCSPYLKVGATNDLTYLHGGFGLVPTVKIRLPAELHDHVTQGTNLVYFDWEYTAETLPQWRYLDDISRMIFDEAHASRLRAAPATLDWLLRNLTNLSHSVTELRQTNPNQLVLTRKSTLGLNALELDILFNWIEMPDFPRGMSTLWRTNPAPFMPVHKRNSPISPAR